MRRERPTEGYCSTLLKPQETLFKLKTLNRKKKEFFPFLNKEITTQTAQNFYIRFWKLRNVNLWYQIMFIYSQTNQVSSVESWRRMEWHFTRKVRAVLTGPRPDTIRCNVGPDHQTTIQPKLHFERKIFIGSSGGKYKHFVSMWYILCANWWRW